MNQELAQKILKENRTVYNKIADHFSRTRYALWPELFEFKKYLKSSQEILDLGCGNGRLIELFKDINISYTGLDNSKELLKQAQQKHPDHNFILGDLNQLPFKNDSFDQVFCIATLQHLPSLELRQQALKEIRRILKPGGYLFMTNWNLWKDKYLKLILKYSLSKIIGKNKLDFKDVYVPWTKSETQKKYLRYYHAFTLKELSKLAKKTNFKNIQQSKVNNNLITVWQK